MFRLIIFKISLFLFAFQGFAQDLDPRAYMRFPLKATTAFAGFSYSRGGVVTDPTLPINNIQADVQSTSIGISRVLNFFGLTSQALVVVPYSWAQVSGDVSQQASSINRSGFADRLGQSAA